VLNRVIKQLFNLFLLVCSRDTSAKAKNGVKELANNVAKSLAKKAERSDVKKLLKDLESKDQNKAGFNDSHHQQHRSSGMASMMHQSHLDTNRSMHEMDLLDPENSNTVNAKKIRTLTADVDIIKNDLMKISSLHVDNSRDILDIRGDLENEVKQVLDYLYILFNIYYQFVICDMLAHTPVDYILTMCMVHICCILYTML
jgi:hypothetical protein